jgi:hypothetical protein
MSEYLGWQAFALLCERIGETRTENLIARLKQIKEVDPIVSRELEHDLRNILLVFLLNQEKGRPQVKTQIRLQEFCKKIFSTPLLAKEEEPLSALCAY